MRKLIGLMCMCGLLAACGKKDLTTADAGGMDAAVGDAATTDAATTDAFATDAPATSIETIPETGSPVTFQGLNGAVNVVRDSRGMVHIYATTNHDAFMVEGYMMAQDRFAAMELVRRQVTGRLAEFGSALDPTLVGTDILSRWMGFRRQATAIYATYAEGSVEKVAMDAFAAGINVYIAELRAGTQHLPHGAEVLNLIVLNPDIFTDWDAIDSLAIGRFLSSDLSYSGDSDIANTEALAATQMAFNESSADAAHVARTGIFSDLWSLAPSAPTFIDPSFMPTSTEALHARIPRAKFPKAETLQNARKFFAPLQQLQALIAAPGESKGSNNWIVSGSRTDSRNPLLANDPHLALGSPALFWYVHLNTKRAGGNMNVQGLALMGVPGVVLGYNDTVAWGVTTAYHDVSDVYHETITPGAGGAADTVLFNSSQVAIEHVTETIKLASGDPLVVTFEKVPHHGLIVPTIANNAVVPRTANEALSVRWTGNDPSNELGAFLALNLASNLDDAKAAIRKFEVGAQNFVVITSDKHIYWSQHARVPVRAAAALTYDPATRTGYAPMFVLPGTGEYEWTGDVPETDIPHAEDPPSGFIVTANNDPTGATADGNPFDAPTYLGWDYDPGYRAARITSRLAQLTVDSDATPHSMQALQADTRSSLGAAYAEVFATAIDHLVAENASSGTYPDLLPVLTSLDGATFPALLDMQTRLRNWEATYATPAAVEGTPTMQEINDSVATTIFNTVLAELTTLTLQDEAAAIGADNRPDTAQAATFFAIALSDTRAPSAATYHDGGISVFDDLTTPDVVETRDERIVRAFLAALDYLETTYSSTVPTDWRWGTLHTVRFSSLIPVVGADVLSIPSKMDPIFPHGFPRHGDMYAVDVGNYNLWAYSDASGTPPTASFAHKNGSQQRLVVEMTPTGPRAWNAIPGGEILDAHSPHFRDEAELWRHNEAPPMYFTESDVVGHFETRVVFTP